MKFLITKPFYFSAILLFLFTGNSFSQTPTDTTLPPTDETDPDSVTVVNKSEIKGLNTLIDLDADDAFLPKILSILSEMSGYNVVAGPEVNNRQRISIHLSNTPIEQAINLVVRAAGLSYEIVGRSFLITNQENLKKEVGITSYYVELKYSKAEEVKALLKGLTENIEVAKGNNALLISTSPKIISEIRTIIEKIDLPSRQIMLQTRVIEVSVDKLKKLGVDWSRLSQLSTILVENPFDPQLGGRSPTAAELGNFELGQLPGQHIPQKITGTENIGHFSRQLTAFDITIDWLLKSNNGRLLTDTKLTTMNNRTATIHIGEVIPFLVQSEQTAQVEREEIGIKLEILPQINNEGFIMATVKPEVSTIIELIDGRIPRKKIRTANTTVLVKDQQKIFIAGLMSETDQMVVHKIPFFGDLLFFGKLFQHLEKSTLKTDLVIEITPFILNNSDSITTVDVDSVFNQMDSLTLARSNYEKTRKGAGPTRYATVPTSHVLKPYQYHIGFREISVGQFGNFQLSASPWWAVGGLLMGIKYEMAPGFSIGMGYHRGNNWGDELYNLGSRFGLFLSKSLVETNPFDWTAMLQSQLGEDVSVGGGTGMALHWPRVVTLLAEASTTYTPNPEEGDAFFDPWATSALRLWWPWLKGLSFEAGITYRPDTYISDLRDFDEAKPIPYFDLAYTGVF